MTISSHHEIPAGWQAAIPRLLTETVLREVELHSEIGSTNDRALVIAASHPSEKLPCLIWAHRQHAGRGRGSNSWWAQSGALTFTILLDALALPLPETRWPLLSLTTGLAVRAALARYCPGFDVAIKWPNDVYIQGKKICGILVEVPPVRNGRVVVGIGVNVNNSFEAAPLELKSKAWSLSDACGESVDVPELLLDLVGHLHEHWQALSEGAEWLPRLWDQECLLRGRMVKHVMGDRVTHGECLGVDVEGCLLLETDQGVRRILGGVIESWH